MFSSAFLSILFATAAVASPAAAPRRSLHRRDHSSDVWCGQVVTGSNFTEVDATWIVPKSYPTQTQVDNQPIYNYQWVGIDGAQSDCQTLLQAGTYYTLINGTSGYGFWYEFYPSGSWLLDEPIVNPGDNVYVKITATSKSTGTAYMLNKSTGKDTTIQLQAPEGSELCGNTVEWIEENANVNATGLAPFDTFSFDNCHALDGANNAYNLKGSESWSILPPDGNQQLCHSTRNNDTSAVIQYDGPK